MNLMTVSYVFSNRQSSWHSLMCESHCFSLLTLAPAESRSCSQEGPKPQPGCLLLPGSCCSPAAFDQRAAAGGGEHLHPEGRAAVTLSAGHRVLNQPYGVTTLLCHMQNGTAGVRSHQAACPWILHPQWCRCLERHGTVIHAAHRTDICSIGVLLARGWGHGKNPAQKKCKRLESFLEDVGKKRKKNRCQKALKELQPCCRHTALPDPGS